MLHESYMDSCGAGRLHICTWEPETQPKAVVQIVHGIAEYALRYGEFAEYLNSLGYLVVAEDHMGHGGSIGQGGIQGYFHGGWFAAVEDTYALMQATMARYPHLPYVLLGHSMGSFMARTLLIQHPDSGIAACIICGTMWKPEPVLLAGLGTCKAMCRIRDEKAPSKELEALAFGGYNKNFDHPRTDFDWVNRDPRQVDAYIADPLCGFTASAALYRDMMGGVVYIQKKQNLAGMNKSLPVHFIAGGDDPVGDRGKGVRKAVEAFQKAGMLQVSCRIYPLCRHELLLEINRQEIYEDIAQWLAKVLPKT